MQIWNKKFEEHLLATYQYDPVSGHVTRKLWGATGPKTSGPIGSITKSGELVIVILFEGRQWMTKLSKLAVFLHTGKQYSRITWKNDVRDDNSFDNLVPIGLPINCEEDVVNNSQQMLEAANARFMERKLELEAEKEARYTKKQQERANKPKKPVDPIKALKQAEALKKAEEKRIAQEGVDEFYKNNPTGIPDYSDPNAGANEAFYQRWKAQRERAMVDTRHVTLSRGLCTGMSASEVKEWWKLSSDILEDSRSPSDYRKDFFAQYNFEDEPIDEAVSKLDKVESDRLKTANMLHWLSVGSVSDTVITVMMEDYSWGGKPTTQKYDQLTPEAEALLKKYQDEEESTPGAVGGVAVSPVDDSANVVTTEGNVETA